MSAPREIRRMNEAQFRRARKLISHLCANCDGGNCLLLDDGEEHVCPQRISYSVLCRYFVAAVLPADRELFADIMERTAGNAAPTAARLSSPPGAGRFTARTALPKGAAAQGGLGAEKRGGR